MWGRVQAHDGTGSAVIGTDAGHCAILDVRSGRAEWCWQGRHERITGVSTVPVADLCSVVVAYGEGQLGMLDLRRQGEPAMLAHVTGGARATCVTTDGNSALAGTQEGLLFWNLDPAAEQTDEDLETGISCIGAGMAFPIQLGDASNGSVSCVSTFQHGNKFQVAVGDDSGHIYLCSGNTSS